MSPPQEAAPLLPEEGTVSARSETQSLKGVDGPSGVLATRRVLLCVAGSIAAYKAPMLLRLLHREGATVDVILSKQAKEFIGPMTFSGLGARVHETMWGSGTELHVELAREADMMIIAPATADCIARLAQGRADDLTSATALCFEGPLFVCPALHPSMWNHAATRHNAGLLEQRGVRFVGPVEGEVASGDSGVGRMAEPSAVIETITRCLRGPGDLAGRHIVVTAGPTVEALDPVRILTNQSSGKMGYAIATVAAARGARVTLISGPVSRPSPVGVEVWPVRSALEMQAALDEALGTNLDRADALVMAAAVSDFRPLEPFDQKLKRRGPITIEFEPNPDLLASIGRRRTAKRPVLVGFALETATADALIALGRNKLIDKRVDLIVANGVESLEQETAEVLLVSAQDCSPLPKSNKLSIGSHILDWIQSRLSDALGAEDQSAPDSAEFSA